MSIHVAWCVCSPAMSRRWKWSVNTQMDILSLQHHFFNHSFSGYICGICYRNEKRQTLGEGQHFYSADISSLKRVKIMSSSSSSKANSVYKDKADSSSSSVLFGCYRSYTASATGLHQPTCPHSLCVTEGKNERFDLNVNLFIYLFILFFFFSKSHGFKGLSAICCFVVCCSTKPCISPLTTALEKIPAAPIISLLYKKRTSASPNKFFFPFKSQ